MALFLFFNSVPVRKGGEKFRELFLDCIGLEEGEEAHTSQAKRQLMQMQTIQKKYSNPKLSNKFPLCEENVLL